MRLLAGLSIIVLGAFVGCGRVSVTPASTTAPSGTAKAAAAPPIKVTPIQPIRKTLVRMVEQPGQVEAFEEAPLFGKVTGYVSKLHVDLGDAVRGPKFDESGKLVEPGQVLCEISVPELKDEHAQKVALVKQAASQIVQAEAAVKVAEAAKISAQAMVAEVEASALRDQAVYDRFRSEAARVTELAKTGALSPKVADETNSQLQGADADRRQTAAKVRSAAAAVEEAGALIDKAKADLDAARARHEVAVADAARTQTLLDYSQIRAPFDGRISARNVDVGHLVRASGSSGETPLFVVVRIDKVRVKVDVPEADAVLIRDGCEATVRIPSLPGSSFVGQVSRSGWSLDPTTRTLRVEVDVENSSSTLRRGMFLTAELKVAVRENVLSLPRAAILTQDKVTFCHVIDSTGKVSRAPVRLGIQSGAEVEIQSGLDGTENVIGTNSAAFKDGQFVEVTTPVKQY